MCASPALLSFFPPALVGSGVFCLGYVVDLYKLELITWCFILGTVGEARKYVLIEHKKSLLN